MFAVVLGLCALAIGPLLGPSLRRHRGLAAGVDAFVVVTVTGLVVLHVLPQSVFLGGVLVLPVAGIGVLVPALLHRFDAAQRPPLWRGGRQVLATALLVLAAFGHALLDGVALIDGEGHGHDGHVGGHEDGGLSTLAIAVLLHRLPYGLALWVTGRERLGRWRTFAVLGALAAGTIVGALLGQQLLSPTTARAFAVLQAFAAGAILHVLLEAPAFDVSTSRRGSFVGVAAGVVVLVTLTRTHPVLAMIADELAFSMTIFVLAARAAPAVLVALALLVLVSVRRQRRLLAVRAAGVGLGAGLSAGLGGSLGSSLGSSLGASLGAALAGVVSAGWASLCGCRVGQVFESLLRRRAGPGGAVAFLVAGPHLELVQVALSVALLGPTTAVLRVAGAVAIALVAGWIVGAQGRNATAGDAPIVVELDTANRPTPLLLLDAVEHVAPWLGLGLVAAAFLEPLLAPHTFAALEGLAGVALAAALGGPLYLCAPAAIPVAAVLLHKSASMGAVVAFLWSVPVMNVTTLGLLARSVSRRAAASLAVVVIVGAIVVGVAVDTLVPQAARWAPSLHELAATEPSVVERVAVALCGALLAWSVARQGARGFLAQILGPLDDAKGGHLHGPHCGHPEHARVGFGRRAPVARVVVDFAVDDERAR